MTTSNDNIVIAQATPLQMLQNHTARPLSQPGTPALSPEPSCRHPNISLMIYSPCGILLSCGGRRGMLEVQRSLCGKAQTRTLRTCRVRNHQLLPALGSCSKSHTLLALASTCRVQRGCLQTCQIASMQCMWRDKEMKRVCSCASRRTVQTAKLNLRLRHAPPLTEAKL